MNPITVLTLIFLLVSVLAAGGVGVLALRLYRGQWPGLPPGEAIYLAAVGGVVAASWAGFVLAELALFSLPALLAVLFTAVALVSSLTLLLCHSRGEGFVVRRFIAVLRLGHDGDEIALLRTSGSPALSLAQGEGEGNETSQGLQTASSKPSRRPLKLSRASLVLLGILALAAMLFFQPDEFVIGGRDPGVYVNTGATIARTGAILVRDNLVPALAPAERALLFGDTPVPWIRSGWPGYQMLDFGQGIVEPHGFHLFPLWLAVFGAVGGTEASLLATPVLGLLSLLSLFFLGRRLLGERVALVAAFLLAINVAQVWYARYPAAEMLVQFLILAGLYVFVLALEVRSGGLAALAGVTLGLVHLTKVEVVFVPAALAIFLGYEYLSGRFRREYIFFLAAYGLLVGHAFLHAILVAPAYTIGQLKELLPAFDYGALDRANPDNPFTSSFALDLLRSNPRPLALAGLAGGLAILVALFGYGRLAGLPAWLLSRRRWLAAGLALVVVGLAAYAYFLRPYVGALPANPGLAESALSDRRSLVWLGWYLSPLGLALAIGGFLHLAATTRSRGVALLLLLALLGTAPYLYRTLIAPDHFWAVRRFLPVSVPAIILLASYAIFGVRGIGNKEYGIRGRIPYSLFLIPGVRWVLQPARRAYILLPAVLVLLLALSYLRATWPFATHREFAGSYGQVAAIAAAVPPEAIVLLEWPAPAQWLGTPLANLFGRATFALQPAGLADPRLAALVARWAALGRPVYWLGRAGPVAPALAGGLAAEPLGQPALRLVHAEAPRDRLPERVEQQVLDLRLYRLATAATITSKP